MHRIKITLVAAALLALPIFLSASNAASEQTPSSVIADLLNREDLGNFGLLDFASDMYSADDTDTSVIKTLKQSRNYYLLGQMYIQKFKYAKAVEMFQKALEADPGSLRARYKIAQSYFLMNKNDKAVQICTEIILTDSQFTPAHLLLAKIFEANRDYVKAEMSYRQILAYEPNNMESLQALGNNYYQFMGNLDKTVEVYEKILTLNSRDIMALVMLGSAYAIKGDVDKCLDLYGKAVHYRPNLVNSYTNLARIFQENGNYEGAQRVYFEALRTAPDNPELFKGFQSFLHLQALRKYSNQKAAEIQEQGITSTTLSLQELVKDKEFLNFLEMEMIAGYKNLSEDGATSNSSLIELYAKILMRYERYDEAARQFRRIVRIDPKDYKAFVALGNIGIIKSDIQSASQAFDQAIAVNPDNQEVYSEIGATYLERKDYKSALDIYKKAIQVKPDEERLYMILFGVYQQLKMDEAAEEILRDALKRFPQSSDILAMLGDFYRQQKRYSEAVDLFKKAYEQKKSFRVYAVMVATLLLEMERPKEAVEFANAAGENFKKNRDFYIVMGLTFSDYGYIDEALEFFKAARDADPASLSSYMLIASLYNKKKEYEKAREVLSSLKKDMPAETDSASYYEILASIYAEQKNNKRAIEAYQKALSYDPKKAGIYLSWALILNREKLYEEAQKVLDEAFKQIDRNSSEGMLLEAQVMTGQKRFDRAEILYSLLLKTDPENIEYIYHLGLMYYEAERHDDAEKSFRMVIEQNPEHADVLNNLGYMFAELGKNLDEAEELIEKAIYLRPGAAYMIDSLGWVYFKKGEYENALKYLLRAEKASLEDPVLFDHLGDTYDKLGQPDKAKDYWKRAFTLDPEIKGLKEKLNK